MIKLFLLFTVSTLWFKPVFWGELTENIACESEWEYTWNKDGVLYSGYYIFGAEREYYVDLFDEGFTEIVLPEYELPVTSDTMETIVLYLDEDLDVTTEIFNTLKIIYDNNEIYTMSNYKSLFYYSNEFPHSTIRPKFTSAKNVFIKTINDEFYLDDFLNQFVIYDYTDKDDIYSKIEIIKDEYTGNEYTYGLYEVEIEVTNSLGYSANHSFNINVIETDSPTFFTKISEIEIDSSDVNELSYYLDQFIVYDYIDGYIDSTEFEIIEDNYTDNKYIEGSHEVIIKVTNSIGNYIEHTIVFTIKNNTHPSIDSPDKIIISNSFNFNMNSLNNEVIAKDIDGQVLEYTIYENTYNNTTAPGTYYITYQVTNELGFSEYCTTEVIVVSSSIEYYALDNNVIIKDYIELLESQIVDLFITNTLYESEIYDYRIDNNVENSLTPNDIFIEILDENNNVIHEGRLIITFLNMYIETPIEIVEEKEYHFDFIYIAVIGVTIIGVAGYFIKKRF